MLPNNDVIAVNLFVDRFVTIFVNIFWKTLLKKHKYFQKNNKNTLILRSWKMWKKTKKFRRDDDYLTRSYSQQVIFERQ